MSRLVFLVEEYSMKTLLDTLLLRLFPTLSFLCIPHEGKQDLEKSIPRKLRAWREPGVQFVVLRDNDGADCRSLKSSLTNLCKEGRRPDTLVRIACQELEAWYLGEPEALEAAYQEAKLRDLGRKSGLRRPDEVMNPAAVLEKHVPEFQKVSGARRMAGHLTRHRNTSPSFHTLVTGVEKLLARSS